MGPKKKSKKILLIVIAILVAVILVVYSGLIIYRMGKINVIANRIEMLFDNSGEPNYRIEELYTISNIDIEKTKDSYDKEYYSFGLDKMIIDKKEYSEEMFITLGDKYFENYNNKTKEYREIPIVEFDTNEYFAMVNKNIQVYNLIMENINMISFTEKLKIAANLSYDIDFDAYQISKEKGNIVVYLTANEKDKFTFSIYKYEDIIKTNYEAYTWRIDLNIVKDYMMEKPDASEYTLVN